MDLYSYYPFNYLLLPVGAGLIILTAYLAVNEVIRWRARVKNIPGPRGLPLVGNLPQVLSSFSAEQYRKWSETFGPVYQVQLGNRPVVVVNSAESAKTLFLTQTSALISRPLFYIFHKVVSKNVASIGTSPWNESCKNRRKLAAGALNRVKVQSYEPFYADIFQCFQLIIRETKDFIQEIEQEAKNGTVDYDFAGAVKRLAMNVVLSLNYGTRVSETKDLTSDKFYVEVIQVEEEISRLRSTSKNLANYIPLLRILEPVLSRLGFQKSAAHSAQIGERRVAYNNVLFDGLRERINAKTDVPCIQGNVMRDPESVTLSSNELMSISLSMMAGADSTQPTLAWAILFLAHHQRLQAKAFEEIRSTGAFVSEDDKTPDIPYITAFVKEILRYYSALPLAMPRETTTDATYQNLVIPKGTMVFLNTWACNRDGNAFEKPWEFHPERWLTGPDRHVHQFAFGYGSRMCVASHLAFRQVYTVLLRLIAHFEIHPATGQAEDVSDPIKGLADPRALTAEPDVTTARFVSRK